MDKLITGGIAILTAKQEAEVLAEKAKGMGLQGFVMPRVISHATGVVTPPKE